MLPQGQFDAFLKGKPEERRKILVACSGSTSTSACTAREPPAAEARREAQFLAAQLERDYGDASPDRLGSLRAELAEAESSAGHAGDEEDALAAAVKIAVTLRTARRELVELEKEAATEASRLAQAEGALARTRERRSQVDRRRQGLHWRAEAALGDPAREAVLAQARTWADELARVTRELAKVESLAASAAAPERSEAEAAKLADRLADAERIKETADRALQDSRGVLDQRRRDLSAHDLRGHLAAGQPCPVCEQSVARVPGTRKPGGLEKAETAVRAAEKALEDARKGLESTKLQREQLTGRIQAAAVERRALEERCELARESRRRLGASLEGAGFLPLAIAEPEGLIARITEEALAAARAREERDRLEDERRQVEQAATRLAAEEATAEAQRAAAQDARATSPTSRARWPSCSQRRAPRWSRRPPRAAGRCRAPATSRTRSSRSSAISAPRPRSVARASSGCVRAWRPWSAPSSVPPS